MSTRPADRGRIVCVPYWMVWSIPQYLLAGKAEVTGLVERFRNDEFEYRAVTHKYVTELMILFSSIPPVS